MSTGKKLTRQQQWTENSKRRRKDIVSAGGRQLILVIEKDHNDLLDDTLAMRRENDPKLSITEWFRRMIVADHKAQLRRRSARASGT